MAAKIMITDDHSLIREGLKQLLELEGDFKVIAEAADGVECINKLVEVTPDVLLLDINMPNMNGLEVLQKMKEKKYREFYKKYKKRSFRAKVKKVLPVVAKIKRKIKK